ncbi:MAG TPA: RIP metalloprotease RseP [Bacilli bacterium]|nr:RIP metalloprotease RseP [Bacilli bacterium]
MLVLLYLILILGLLIFIHELGHFLFAKKFGVHIYEFALGMGPRILKKTGKDGIIYSLRLFPIGGFVSMAGEVNEDDEKVQKEKFMCNKPWLQRVVILIAGVTFNFLLALLVLLVSGLIWGSYTDEPIIADVIDGYPMKEAGIEANDKVLRINGYKINNWDKANVVVNLKDKDGVYKFEILKTDGTIETYSIKPVEETNEDGEEQSVFGFYMANEKETGFINALKYAFRKFGDIVSSMAFVVAKLFTGQLSLKALAGPVGMYSVVGESVEYGLESITYLIALLSINLGFINILPFPAFDGGRILFLIIEKIKGSKVNSKVENVFHTVGFILLMLLMLYITFQDVLKLFK